MQRKQKPRKKPAQAWIIANCTTIKLTQCSVESLTLGKANLKREFATTSPRQPGKEGRLCDCLYRVEGALARGSNFTTAIVAVGEGKRRKSRNSFLFSCRSKRELTTFKTTIQSKKQTKIRS